MRVRFEGGEGESRSMVVPKVFKDLGGGESGVEGDLLGVPVVFFDLLWLGGGGDGDGLGLGGIISLATTIW